MIGRSPSIGRVSPPSVRSLPYSGETPTLDSSTGEGVVLTGLSAAISYGSGASRADNKLPASVQPSGWLILIPRNEASRGQIWNRDIVVDDQGNRYQVNSAPFLALGYQLHCTLLEV